jgi:uncharacterized protein
VPEQRPWRVVADGLTVAVRLTPKGGRDALEGVERLADGTSVLKARVRAIPHEGAANEALTVLVAKALKVAPGRVRLTAGATNRVKTLRIDGDGAALAATLERIAA